MNSAKIHRTPFIFKTRLYLTALTGLKARNLAKLLTHLKKLPGSVIYYHTHRFLQQHEFLSSEPPNAFASRAIRVLNTP